MNAITDLWPEARHRGVLRLVTAGSVDDGKSTLIGRLLLDSKGVYADQLSAIAGSRYSRAPDDTLDLALLTDGLEAEREQGITIDVAYRYFATPARKFIIADAPGHEQYTRNMVTGTSTADAAVILIDAARARDGQLLPQTKRHATLGRLLGLRHIVFAINKMDQVQWSETVFERIRASVAELAQRLAIAAPHCVPLSALTGDNVVQPSGHMPWYGGEPLLPLLESLPLAGDASKNAVRFFVQWVIRHEGSSTQAFRGYAGQLQGGLLRVGDEVQVLPAARRRACVRCSAVKNCWTPPPQATASPSCLTARSMSRAAICWSRPGPYHKWHANSRPTCAGSTARRSSPRAGTGSSRVRASRRRASRPSPPNATSANCAPWHRASRFKATTSAACRSARATRWRWTTTTPSAPPAPSS